MYILQNQLREQLIKVNFDWSLFISFLTSIINSWPLAVILIFLMLRGPIINLIKSIGSFEYKDGKVSAIVNSDILNELTKLEKNTKDLNDKPSEQSIEFQFEESNKSKYNETNSYNKENVDSVLFFGSSKKENTYLIGLVASLHRDLEKILHENYVFAINQVNPSKTLDLDRIRKPITLYLSYLFEKKLIDEITYTKTKKMISIRNKIMHNIDIISNKTLEEYIIQTQLIIDELSKILYSNKRQLEQKF